MSLKLYAVSFIVIAALFSCAQKNDKDEIDESLISPPVANQPQDNKLADSSLTKTINIQPATAAANPITSPGNTAPVFSTPVNNTQPQTQPGAIQLNPAHGQPGHRCDISVGAPLNSKPAQPNANPATISTVPATVNTNVQNAVQKTLPGMNPPHGLPGHRCDISVGAPLNSKPVPAANPVVTNVAPPVNSASQPADSSKN
jgi:hypothetical protein